MSRRATTITMMSVMVETETNSDYVGDTIDDIYWCFMFGVLKLAKTMATRMVRRQRRDEREPME
jgi:hypothetical protein